MAVTTVSANISINFSNPRQLSILSERLEIKDNITFKSQASVDIVELYWRRTAIKSKVPNVLG